MRILTITTSKRLLKVAVTNMAKRVKVEQKKSIISELVFFLQNESDLDILMLIFTQQ